MLQPVKNEVADTSPTTLSTLQRLPSRDPLVAVAAEVLDATQRQSRLRLHPLKHSDAALCALGWRHFFVSVSEVVADARWMVSSSAAITCVGGCHSMAVTTAAASFEALRRSALG